MKTDTITITRRSRNLGFAWSSSPQQRYTESGDGYLTIPPPRCPSVQGGPRSVLAAAYAAARVNAGNSWAGQYFVAGRPIIAVEGNTAWAEQAIFNWLQCPDYEGASLSVTLG